jgi:hypothetical protein
LIETEISVASDPSITGQQRVLGRADVRKQIYRFAASPNRAASDVCDDYLRLARNFGHASPATSSLRLTALC